MAALHSSYSASSNPLFATKAMAKQSKREIGSQKKKSRSRVKDVLALNNDDKKTEMYRWGHNYWNDC